MSKKKPILFLVGPTAVGKTEFAIHLARHLSTDMGADSMQIYQYMDIGTGKPTPHERAQVYHHLVDFVHPSEPYSVGRYLKDADAVIHELHQQGKVPLIVGGTGLYMRSITNGLFDGPEADPSLRKHFKEIAAKEGLNFLYERLKNIDPVGAKRIHPNDERRLIRALEVHEITGNPITVLQDKEKSKRDLSYTFILFGLTASRNKLYANIETRVDQMIERGLVDEVRSLLKMGVKEDSIAMQGLGYKEILPTIYNQRPLERSIEILKKETRHFAKRQITWFKAEQRIHGLDLGDFRTREEAINSLIKLADIALQKAT